LNKISIITPCFNAISFIERCVESVASQGGLELEHIIVDGNSTDGTQDKLKSLSKKYNHIKWVSETDKGQSDAMNKGFAMSNGEIIGYLNADDWYADNALKKVSEVFSYNNIDLIVGKLNQVYVNYKIESLPSIKIIDLLDYMSFKWPINPVCYFYRRKIQKSVGPFPVDMHNVMDYWFLLRAFKIARRHAIPELFGNFDYHGTNKSVLTALSIIHAQLRQTRSEFLNKDAPYSWKLRLAIHEKYPIFIRKTGLLAFYYRVRNVIRRANSLFR
jgi:glycosyltransferase involved in cell wall biosynthesis